MKLNYTALPLVLLLPALVTSQRTAPARKGLEAKTIEVKGAKREYLVHVPSKAKGKKDLPLVLMLHGRGSDNRAASSRYYGWIPMSNKAGFIAVFPNAQGRPKSWKAAWGRKTTDDTQFLAALIDKLLVDYKIDKKRVFMTGHSSGGIMSFSFAATHSKKVAAIAPVAGSIGWGRTTIPKPKGPVSVISFHGKADSVVPYDKKNGKNSAYSSLVGAPQSVDFWVKHNGCDKKPKTQERGRIRIDTWSGGKNGAQVVFYSIERGSHAWPTKRRGVDATPLIWDFFSKMKSVTQSKGTKKKAPKKRKRLMPVR